MIVVSYIGTGKTSTCRNVNKYIDLNVNLFNTDTKDWYINYCNLAIYLSNKGNTVFTPAYKEIIDYFMVNRDRIKDKQIVLIYPTTTLKEDWINYLKTVYTDKYNENDYKSYIHCKNNYLSDINYFINTFGNCGINGVYDDFVYVREITDRSFTLNEILYNINDINVTEELYNSNKLTSKMNKTQYENTMGGVCEW